MRTLKAGIIGCGQMGRNHASAYQELVSVDLVAAHDKDEPSADRLCSAFGIHQATLPELLEAVDIVSICTWPSSHCTLALEALHAGRHVLCEKPPAANAEEVRKMLELAEDQDVVLTFGLLYRYAFPDAADIVRDVGQPYKVTGKWLRRFGFPKWGPAGYRESLGGALTDLGVHVIDLAWYLVGCPDPTVVHAKTWNHRAREFAGASALAEDIVDTSYTHHPVDDSAFLFLQLDNECSVMIEVAYSADIADDEQVSVEIQGSRGRLVLPVPTTQAAVSPDLLPRLHRSGEYTSEHTIIHRAPRLVRDAVREQLANFRDAVLRVRPPVVPASDAVTLQRILDMALWSARTGEPLTMAEPRRRVSQLSY